MKRKIKSRNTGKYWVRKTMDDRKYVEILLNIKNYSEIMFMDLTHSIFSWYSNYRNYASCVRRSRNHDSTLRVQEYSQTLTYMNPNLYEDLLHRPIRSDMLLDQDTILITVRNN